MGTFDDNRRRSAAAAGVPARRLPPRPARWSDVGFERRVERFPFVPADPARLAQDCYEAYNIQVSGLVQRLRRGAASGASSSASPAGSIRPRR